MSNDIIVIHKKLSTGSTTKAPIHTVITTNTNSDILNVFKKTH